MEKKNARFSPLEKHKIMDLKSQGHGYKAIATRLELSCESVKSFIRRHKDDPQYSTYLMGRCKECDKELLNPHIVSPEVFDMVQAALLYRKQQNMRFSGSYPFGGRVFCSSCGSFFGHKILQRRRNGRLTRKEIWRCNSYYDGNIHPHSIKDAQMSAGLSVALQTAIENNMDVVDLCWEMMKTVHPRLQRQKYEKIIRSIYEDANKTRKNILFLHFFIDKVVVSDGLHLTYHLKDGTQIDYN